MPRVEAQSATVGGAMKSIENLLIALVIIGLLIMAGGFVAQAMAKKKKQQ